jgi:DNA-directed RNA polymerase subunit alpha
MRVGDRTDFDRLFLEVETDGTIDPEEAIFQASEILSKHFSIITEGVRKVEKPQKEKPVKAEEDALKTKVEDLKFSTRTLNALVKNNIKTVAAILKKNEESLKALDGMGEKSLKEIKRKLKKIGLELK